MAQYKFPTQIILNYDDDPYFIYDLIENNLKCDNMVLISFEKIDIMNLDYFNKLFNKLYIKHSSLYLNTYIKLFNITDTQLSTLQRILQTSKQYHNGK